MGVRKADDGEKRPLLQGTLDSVLSPRHSQPYTAKKVMRKVMLDMARKKGFHRRGNSRGFQERSGGTGATCRGDRSLGLSLHTLVSITTAL